MLKKYAGQLNYNFAPEPIKRLPQVSLSNHHSAHSHKHFCDSKPFIFMQWSDKAAGEELVALCFPPPPRARTPRTHEHASICNFRHPCVGPPPVSQVTVNWFQMQQVQNVTLPTHFQALSESAKLYEPGERYAEFVRNLPKDLPKGRLHSDSVSSDR